MPVVDGTPVDAANTNPAFLDAQNDDTALGRLTLANTLPESGASIANVQRGVNSLFDGTGINEEGTTGTDYNGPSGTVDNGDDHETAIGKLAALFEAATGHMHDGSQGGGGVIDLVTSLNGVTGIVSLVASGGTVIDAVGQDIRIFSVTGGGGEGGGAYDVTGSLGSPYDYPVSGGFLPGTEQRQLAYIQGDGGHVDITGNPQVASGNVNGQELLFIGANNAQTVLFEDGNGLLLNGPADLARGNTLQLIWSEDDSLWIEGFRNF